MNYEDKRATLIEYLKVKTQEADWHGVSDAANDLRVLEASLPYQPKEGPVEDPTAHQQYVSALLAGTPAKKPEQANKIQSAEDPTLGQRLMTSQDYSHQSIWKLVRRCIEIGGVIGLRQCILQEGHKGDHVWEKYV